MGGTRPAPVSAQYVRWPLGGAAPALACGGQARLQRRAHATDATYKFILEPLVLALVSQERRLVAALIERNEQARAPVALLERDARRLHLLEARRGLRHRYGPASAPSRRKPKIRARRACALPCLALRARARRCARASRRRRIPPLAPRRVRPAPPPRGARAVALAPPPRSCACSTSTVPPHQHQHTKACK